MSERPVKRKRVETGFCMESLGQDNLDNITGLDILPRPFNHLMKLLLLHV